LQNNLDISWTLSIALVGSIIRLSQIPMYFFIRNINFDKMTPNFILIWKNKLFIQDFLIDSNKFNLSKIEQKDMIKSYETNYILTWFYQVFSLRSCYFIYLFRI